MPDNKEARKIPCRVYCEDEGFSFSEDVTIELEEDDRKSHAEHLLEALIDNDPDFIEFCFIDIIENALEQFELVPCGEFDWEYIIEQIQDKAHAYVTKAAESIHLYIDEYDNNGNVIETSELDVEDSLLESVDGWCEDEQSACTSGEYIEKSLFKFAEESRWQFGLQKDDNILCDSDEWPDPLQENGVITWNDRENVLQPIMWFGLPNREPYKTWTAVPYDEENGSIWFEDDAWYILGRIIGDETDDFFLTWYFPECGNTIPDINEIKNACPVQWDESDTQDSLNNKISRYMLGMKFIAKQTDQISRTR